MDKEIKELMQINVISENKILSEMIEDLMPLKDNNNTSINKIEIINKEKEISKNQEFRIVVYKKENPVIKLFKEIKYAIKKLNKVNSGKEIKLANNKLDI